MITRCCWTCCPGCSSPNSRWSDPWSTVPTLVDAAQRLRPDAVVIDVIMPGLSGLEVGRLLQACAPDIRLIYLTMEASESVAAEAFAVGASAFLSKAGPASELQHAIRVVRNGGRYLVPTIADGDVEALGRDDRGTPAPRLSPRELEVVKLLLGGLTMKSVGRQLGIAPRTVAFHKYRAMDILGLRSNAELIDYAIRHGLLGHHRTVTTYRRDRNVCGIPVSEEY